MRLTPEEDVCFRLHEPPLISKDYGQKRIPLYSRALSSQRTSTANAQIVGPLTLQMFSDIESLNVANSYIVSGSPTGHIHSRQINDVVEAPCYSGLLKFSPPQIITDIIEDSDGAVELDRYQQLNLHNQSFPQNSPLIFDDLLRMSFVPSSGSLLDVASLGTSPEVHFDNFSEIVRLHTPSIMISENLQGSEANMNILYQQSDSRSRSDINYVLPSSRYDSVFSNETDSYFSKDFPTYPPPPVSLCQNCINFSCHQQFPTPYGTVSSDMQSLNSNVNLNYQQSSIPSQYNFRHVWSPSARENVSRYDPVLSVQSETGFPSFDVHPPTLQSSTQPARPSVLLQGSVAGEELYQQSDFRSLNNLNNVRLPRYNNNSNLLGANCQQRPFHAPANYLSCCADSVYSGNFDPVYVNSTISASQQAYIPPTANYNNDIQASSVEGPRDRQPPFFCERKQQYRF